MVRKTKLRILLVSVTPFKGGGETHLAKLARLLAGRYQLHAIVCNPWLQEQMEGLGLPVTRIPAGGLILRYLLVAFAVIKQCLFFRPDVAHLNGQGEAYFSPLFLLMGIKTVITRHSILDFTNKSLPQRIVHRCHKFAARIVCVSSLVRRDMENIVSHDRLVTIPNWLMEDQLSQPRRFHFSEEPFRLLFVGRLIQLKGLRELIAAMKCLDQCTLEVLGEGPEHDDLVSRAQGLPVVFRGVVNDCNPYYDHADLLVFPSYPLEGQGQTPLEAMGRGLPCLMSDIEVSLETSDGGRAAALFHSRDVEDLVRKIEQLRDADQLTKLSQAGFERVQRHYSASVIQPLYFRLFDELAAP